MSMLTLGSQWDCQDQPLFLTDSLLVCGGTQLQSGVSWVSSFPWFKCQPSALDDLPCTEPLLAVL